MNKGKQGTDKMKDTIAAISTPLGEGGIGIVRLSGGRAVEIAESVFHSQRKRKLSECQSHTVNYGFIGSDGEIIDEVLVTIMRAPATYTREDIVEINCHGGILPLGKVLDLVLRKGARLAEPGEFTKLAFLNGRIDLSQAEAVIDLIRSQSDLAIKSSLSQLRGIIKDKVGELCDIMCDILVQVEASIDFIDEELDIPRVFEHKEKLVSVQEEIRFLISSADEGQILREGINTVIVGKPNVGKSSLFNALAETERVIVSPIPGTTRDVIKEIVNIEGIVFKITDTAGIREPRDFLEEESITRSQSHISKADLILLVLDGSTELEAEDEIIIDQVSKFNPLVVINKMDLPAKIDVKMVGCKLPECQIVNTCAIKNKNINVLKKMMKEQVWQGEIVLGGERPIITNIRHKEALVRAKQSLKEACNSIEQGMSEEFIAFDLRQVISALGEIVGNTTTDDVLDRIFSQFCIGK